MGTTEPVGRCHRIFYEDKVTAFMLMSPHDLLFLTAASLTSDLMSYVVESDVLIAMQRVKLVFLPEVAGKTTCREGRAMDGDFGLCVIGKLGRAYEKMNLSCVPVVFVKVLAHLGLDLCEDVEENRKAVNLTLGVISRGVTRELGCLRECTRAEAPITPIPITIGDVATEADYNVVIYYRTEDEMKLRQYLLYTTPSFASAVGGAMGMFLGWSVYQTSGDIWRSGVWVLTAAGILRKKKK